MRCRTKTLICFWLTYVVFVSRRFMDTAQLQFA